MSRGIFLLVALLAGWAHAASLESAEQIQDCVAKNFPAKTSQQELRLTTIDRLGNETLLEAELFWKRFEEDRSRVLVTVDRPSDVRGSSYLMIEREGGEEMFSYLPALRKVRRIQSRTVSGSLFGTDFSYEDMAHLQGLNRGTEVERLPDDEVGGRPAYALAANPRTEESSYSRIVTHVDHETCVPLQVDFYEGEELRKVYSQDPTSLRREGEIWVARHSKLQDLSKGTTTRVEIDKIEFDVDLKDRIFTQSYLERGPR
jgi:outer membrane lipoprotein-sorting protein